MKYKLKIVFLGAILLLGCKAINTTKMSDNPMINAAIKSYFDDQKGYIKKYSVFHVSTREAKSKNVQVYNILPENNQIAFALYLEDSLNNKYLPTHYLEYQNKIFLWREGKEKTPKNVMQYIYSKGLVDSSYVKFQMGKIPEEEIQNFDMITDESLKSMNYIFCESEPGKVKKRIASNYKISPDDKRLQIKCE